MSSKKDNALYTKQGLKGGKLFSLLSLPISQYSKDQIWEKWQIHVFRFLFIFFLFFIIPLDPKFYVSLFSVNWLESPFYGLLTLARYQPEFIPLKDELGVPVTGLASYANWGLGLVIALIGSLIWNSKDKGATEYNVLWFWLRVFIRYRLAVVLFAYGVYKLFLLQIPAPSLSNLFTHYGDAYAWKIYYQTTSLSSFYVAFLGVVEILAALLLFFRKSVTWGAGLILGYVGNIAVANSFYDLGDLSLSTFIVLSAAVLFASDAPRLFRLLIQEKLVKPSTLYVDFSIPSWRVKRQNIRFVITAFFAAVLVTGYLEYNKGFGTYKYPKSQGLSDAFGAYDVKQFVLNGDTLAYSNIDSTRWQNVIFEKWSTISVRSHKPVIIDKSTGEEYQSEDLNRNYELAGFTGRHYYHYEIDSVTQTLHFINKNRNHRDEAFSLNYKRPNNSTIELSGKIPGGDEVNIVLERIEKKYMLLEGRRKASRL